tara:strand:+ start:1445 stop:1633 length:189 start_codon:yes stop_codon:yes gene_type:complete
MKEQLIRTIDYTNVMYADFAIVIAVLITALFWKEQRWFLVGMGSVYLFATMGFHFDLLPTSN